ncbi:MAG: zinc-dependent alcohol dehydrogenase family protein [Gemmataceae bacterium]|nr:zinc-dependent alcohol dehydrogenase family protein [Gemmataceae bacterium]MCS7270544.1 zinc-dependent alcohol dehydrogenase family protein [Gemmataceae bacterium]MDW8243867.1 zinc-dependent alcohol dehydrogenase family protein [Thermogemmata sp.]
MKRLVFARTGPPAEVLRLEDDVPTPVPQRGEVLVRMLAAPINPSDLMFIGGRYGLQPQVPAVPGFEGVGIVVSQGGGLLARLRLGQRVALLGARSGTWTEYTVAAARQVLPVPDDWPDEQAATFFVNPATALAMVRYVLRVPRGAWLLQTAAASEVGKMVIRLGRWYGFRTLNVIRRPEQREQLQRLGADVILLDSDGPLAEQVARHAPEGVRFGLDPVGGPLGSALLAALAPGAHALIYGSLADAPLQVDPRLLISTGLCVQGFWLARWLTHQNLFRLLRFFRRVRRLIGQGVLQSSIAAVYPLEQYLAALEHASRPGKGGKVLLRLGSR